MAILRADEIREMSDEEIQNELENLRSELLQETSIQAAGGAPDNPGRIGEMKKTIARIKTIQTERETEETEEIVE
ncbi:MAG: 50S ribosomal protein L29 [Halobacteriales archaeon]|nr:50S ribosomal protein L29 [Halobacteriales archaeon]